MRSSILTGGHSQLYGFFMSDIVAGCSAGTTTASSCGVSTTPTSGCFAALGQPLPAAISSFKLGADEVPYSFAGACIAKYPTLNTACAGGAGTVAAALDRVEAVLCGLSTSSTAAFITDCATFLAKLNTTTSGGCVPTAIDAATSYLTLGASGVAYRTVAGGSSAIACADLLVKEQRTATGGCIPDAPAGVLPQYAQGVDAANAVKYFAPQDVYHTELQLNATPLSFAAQGFNTLNDIVWTNQNYEAGLRGAASWYNAVTGRIVIGRDGAYEISLNGMFIRARLGGGSTAYGHAYSGFALFTASPYTVNGVAVTRLNPNFFIRAGGEQSIPGDGSDHDSVHAGSSTVLLKTGDQIVVRVVLTNTPTGTAPSLTSFSVNNSGGAIFTIRELPQRTLTL
jgi:hypothetical protein